MTTEEFRFEIQPGSVSKHPHVQGEISSTDTEIIVEEELHVAFYSAEAGLLNYPC